VFDELERFLWKIVVEGPEDMQGRLHSLKTIYYASIQEAQNCRAYFLQLSSTNHAVDDNLNEENWINTENGARTHDNTLVALDDRPQSNTPPCAPVSDTQPVSELDDDDAMLQVLDNNARPPSDADHDVVMHAIDTHIAENSRPPSMSRDSSPLTVIEETDNNIPLHDSNAIATSRMPRKAKLVFNHQKDILVGRVAARRVATSTTRTRTGTKRRRINENEDMDIGDMPGSWRSVVDVAGVVSHLCV
jgi:hypothetical protein